MKTIAWMLVASASLGCAADDGARGNDSASVGSIGSITLTGGADHGTAGSESPSGTAGDSSGGSTDATPSSASGVTVGVFDVGQGSGIDSTGMMECAGDQNLMAAVRDFQEAHPDFEYVIAVDPGIVQTNLGGDDKPVYNGPTPTTTTQANFDQWYRDVVGVNIPIMVPLVLTDAGDGTYFFDNQEFFPIDGQGWGNEGHDHNFHFTLELHTEFIYNGGEVFSFTGDDDLFTFVNGKLAIDLGGVHGAMNGIVDLDAQAAALGISPGNKYRLDFFFAERHTSESHFRIDTTIGCLVDVPVG